MKKDEIQIENMQFGLIGYIDHNNAIWLGDTIFGNCLDMQRGLKSDLDTAKDKQLRSSKGFTVEKLIAYNTGNNKAFIICSAVKLLSNFNNDKDLFDKVDYNMSDLDGLGYSKVETVWKAIKKAANDNIAALSDGYHITPQTLIDFQTLIDNFKQVKPRPGGAIKTRKEGTSEIGEITKKIQINLHDYLDNAIVPYIDINLDFYQGYLLRRELTDIRTDKLAVRINLIEKVSHDILCKVRMRIEGIDKVRKSSEFGNIIIPDLSTGTYNLIFEREDLVTYTETIHHEKGITTDLHIQMEKKP